MRNLLTQRRVSSGKLVSRSSVAYESKHITRTLTDTPWVNHVYHSACLNHMPASTQFRPSHLVVVSIITSTSNAEHLTCDKARFSVKCSRVTTEPNLRQLVDLIKRKSCVCLRSLTFLSYITTACDNRMLAICAWHIWVKVQVT